MSDEGEKTCPLCAEEMDFTDQQLKPCKCGYEICVWCWHHIMDMAEKADTEGRCPACRMPYDKEKIVGTAANCGRAVAEHGMEKKKSQKSKAKTSEGRKQLTSVRVIQRNLVYIVGLPLDLADEDLLQRKEYFYQYGKVLKVSISRTSAGTIQQYANSTCSVYITYSKEEEAVRCIQSVHGFILDGRPLRACFGTTKYCHAWLRNVPCTNPDCLYLHEIGSHEDSFTKDEIISAYTRVQQITGLTSSMQRRSGNILPPPADDYCNNGSGASGKSVAKVVSNNPVNNVSTTKGSPPTSSSGRSAALPPAASWGARASNCQSLGGNLACLNGPSKQKPDAAAGSLSFSTAVTSITRTNAPSNDVGKKPTPNDEGISRQHKSKYEVFENVKHHNGVNIQTNVSEISSSVVGAPATTGSKSQAPTPPSIEDYNNEASKPIDTICSVGKPSKVSGLGQDLCSASDRNSQTKSFNISLSDIDKQPNGDRSEVEQSSGSGLDNLILPKSQILHPLESDKLVEQSASTGDSKASTSGSSESTFREAHGLRSQVETPCQQNLSSQPEDDFDDQRLKDAVLVRQPTVRNTSHPLHLLNHIRSPLPQLQPNDADRMLNHNVHHPTVNKRPDEELMVRASGTSVVSNGYLENSFSSTAGLGNAASLSNGGAGSQTGRYNEVDSNPTLDMESNIISNILSLELDSWDDSLTSPQNLAKLLGEADKPHGSLPLSNSRKGHNSNQSRFSFARQDDYRNQQLDTGARLNDIGQASNHHSFSQTYAGRDSYVDRIGNGFGYSYPNAEHSDNLTSYPACSSNKHSASRAQISAPPGFSVPSRPPPPGFSSSERTDHAFDVKSGHHLFETSSLSRNPYQSSPSVNASCDGDIELMDPAIIVHGRLPVGINNSSFDMRQSFSSQSAAIDNESRLQLLMQRSISPHQNLRYNDVRDLFTTPNDAYGFNSRHVEQSQAAHLSPYQQFSIQQSRNPTMSNGHWDGWNEVQGGNDVGIADLLRHDRLGFNKLYGSYEDSKFQMPSSGSLYNQTYGI